MWTELDTIACPFCAGFSGSCCRCAGARRVPFARRLLTWVWEIGGCACDTCRALREMH